jgi:hypothetical protein
MVIGNLYRKFLTTSGTNLDLVKSIDCKMLLEMCRSFLTNHLQPKTHKKIA